MESDLSVFDHDDPSFYLDPQNAFARIHREQPVLYSEAKGGFWLLSRYDDVRAGLLDWRSFSSAGVGAVSLHAQWPPEAAIAELPINYDPPQHTRYRALVAPWFSREQLAPLEAQFRDDARLLLRALRESGGGDAVRDFALPFVLKALTRFLGVPVSDAERFDDYSPGIFIGRAADPSLAEAARFGLIDYVREMVAAHQGGDAGDFFSFLADRRIDSRALTDDEALSYGVMVWLAGVETTVTGIANSIHHLGTVLEDQARLRESPHHTEAAVEELLRLRSPVQLLGRWATDDVEIGSRVIAKGSSVAMAFGGANVDADVFPNPLRFEMGRKASHLAFGAGRHKCLGSTLARLEMNVALEEALALLPTWEVAPDGGVEVLPRGELHGYWRLPIRFNGVP